MANPQPDKFTKISNELMESIPKYKFNGTQLRILFVIIRYTYGFNRKEADLSLTFISKATGAHKEQIKRELNVLIDKKVVSVVKEAGFNTTRIVKLNKNYDEWGIDRELKIPQVANPLTGSEEDYIQVANPLTPTGSELAPQEIHSFKDNIKDIYEYYISLDLVKHRTFTEDIKKSIVSAMKNNKYTIDYCKVLLDRHKKVVEITKKSEKPVQVRGLTEFFGQKAYQAKHLICSEYEEGGKYYEKYLKGSTPERKLAPKDFKKVFLPLRDEQDG
jgi:phage replication O-like protein O